MELQINAYYNRVIENSLQSGKYSSKEEVVQAGLELLEKEQKHFLVLEKAILDGEKSGFSTPFDNEKFKKKMAEKYSK